MRKRIELYASQHDFVLCRDRFAGFVGGIGSGKSYAGAVKGLLEAGSTKCLGVVTAPTYPMLRDATLRTYLDLAGDAIVDFHRSEMLATLANGSEVLFRSADNPDRLRGPNISWWHGDEASLYGADVWPVMIGRLREGGKAGRAWITFTPKGRNWIYHRLSEFTLFRARTRDNPYLDDEFIRSLEASYTGGFARQELEGEFVSFEGLVYEDFDRTRHVQDRPGPFKRYVAGLDEGYTNPAVILVVGLDHDDRAHVAEEFYRRRVLQGEVVAEAKRLQAAYGIEMFFADPSAAGLIADLRANHVRVVEATNDVLPGIQRVKAVLAVQGDSRPRLTVQPSCVNVIAEFESYIWKEGRHGVKDEPEKANDHALDALRYALMGIHRTAKPATQPTKANPFGASPRGAGRWSI